MVLYSEKDFPELEYEYAGSEWTQDFIREQVELSNVAMARSEIGLVIDLVHMEPVSGVMLILLIIRNNRRKVAYSYRSSRPKASPEYYL